MSCVFCRIVAGQLPASRVFEDEDLLAFLDIHPWRPGHTLVIPKRHCQRVADLDGATRDRIFALGTTIGVALRKSTSLSCRDVHFVLNDGPAASQTVPHVHLHLVPRTGSDFWRLIFGVARHGAGALVRAAPRDRLEEQAAEIRRWVDREASSLQSVVSR